MDIRSGIRSTAKSLGIDPVDLATAISYETAGTFDPTKRGPTTQWGQHRGLIQFGEPQAKKYGVNWDDPLGSQLGPQGAVANYLRDTGVKPGMGMMDIYSAINAGGVGRNNRSDANNGGAPGTVADKVNSQMAGHRRKAEAMFGGGSDDTLLGGLSMRPDRMGAPPILDTMEAPAMEPQKATGILGSLFGDMTQERADKIRLGVNGMLHNPNRGLERQVQGRMDDRRDEQKTHAAAQQAAQQANKTASWLATQPGGEQFAQAIASGALPAGQALDMWRTQSKPEYTYQDGQWYDKNNPQAGPVAMPAGATAPVDVKGESELRREYTGRPDVKSFKGQATAFAQINAAAAQPDAAGDLALIFSFMKLMDPGSTVREGEFLTAQNATGVDQRTRNVWNNLQTGERLSPEQRAEFIGRAGKLYEAARIQNESTETQFRDIASQYGYDTDRAVPDVSYQSPYAPAQSPRPGARPPAPPAGSPTAAVPPAMTREQLAAAVSGLSPHEKQLLSSIPGAQAKVRFLMDRGVINGQR